METFFATQLQWIGSVGELAGRASGLTTTFFNYPRGFSFGRSGQTKLTEATLHRCIRCVCMCMCTTVCNMWTPAMALHYISNTNIPPL